MGNRSTLAYGPSDKKFALRILYCVIAIDALTVVKTEWVSLSNAAKVDGADHVMLPGIKQRNEVPSDPFIGPSILTEVR
jgi:hypothetical protein